MPRENAADRQARALRLLQQLKRLYPDAHCSLTHANPLQLLVATILSAQCTDARVNLTTPALFKRFPTAKALAEADRGELEKLIQSTGFFRSKAKSIQTTARELVETYGGEVPDTMEALNALAGVGRKTANVVLGNAFGKNVGVVVDTHVGRLSRRLGFTKQTDPEKVETDLIKLFPQDDWTLLSHMLIDHGRAICWARNPQCHACPIAADCPSRGKEETKHVINLKQSD
jgi:endonuclease-3